MSTIFSKIVRGDIPCYKVAENDEYLAFLDVNPLVKGHVLVVPKLEVDYIFDLEDSVLSGLILFSKEVAIKIKKVFPCEKIGVTVIGLEVPHAHVHLVPMNEMKDMSFLQPKLKLASEELEIISQLISNA